MQADFFIASSNAVTEDGALVNTDGTGNRIAAMFFGPKKVIIVAGVNKLVPDLEAAMKRIKDVAAPLNAKRLGLKTPCAKTENCYDCSSHERICKITAVMDAPSSHTEKVYVILVGEELGY
jgi:L-lactate utilization protein LutB